jgi:hypothetical protein
MARLLSTLRARLAAERGAIMVEVMVGTVLLAMGTMAILNGIDGAQSTNRKNKARTVASTLAQQDQERLRSLPVTMLAGMDETRNVAVSGVTYAVRSRQDWVDDSNGALSCTNETSQAQYMKVSSTVTAPSTPGRPVTESSLITPPVGAFGTNVGTAAVKLTNRSGQPLANQTVQLVAGSTLSETTNEFGCAVFGQVASGSWTVRVSNGLVGWGGTTPVDTPMTVAPNKMNLSQVELDTPASLRATLQTSSGTAATWKMVSAANAKMPQGFKSSSTSSSPQQVHDVGSLFPFLDGYGVFAGNCAANNPALWRPDYFQASGKGAVVLNPGDVNKAVNVEMPTLNVTVLGGSGGTTPQTNRPVKLERQDSTHNCTGHIGTLFGISWTTNSSGQVSLQVPFGHYRACSHSSSPRRRFEDVDLTFTGEAATAPATKNLTIVIPTSGSSGSCPG